MKTRVTSLLLLVFAMPLSAQNFSYRSAEHALGQASDLETWRQQLRYYERQLGEREQTVFGKLEESQQQYQQGMQHAAEREETLRRQLQQQQEQTKNQAFHTQLQQQQEEARRRETALQRQLEAQQERKAFERLQQGKQLSTLQHQLQEQQSQASGQQPQQANAYGYADKQLPRSIQEQDVGGSQQVMPLIQAPPKTHILIFDAPTPVATVAALESKINTTINGIDRIDTRAILPESLSVEQLEAVKHITDNGALIAQQRFGLEQYQLDTDTQLSRLRVVKSFVLWGLLCSIPTLLTLYWIVRNIALGWRSWQQEKLSYQLKELESVERQITGTERQYHADHQR